MVIITCARTYIGKNFPTLPLTCQYQGLLIRYKNIHRIDGFDTAGAMMGKPEIAGMSLSWKKERDKVAPPKCWDLDIQGKRVLFLYSYLMDRLAYIINNGDIWNEHSLKTQSNTLERQ